MRIIYLFFVLLLCSVVHAVREEVVQKPTSIFKNGIVGAVGESVQKALRVTAPLAALFLTTKAHNEVPMNKQSIPFHGSFFQGWLMRMVDHEQNLSVMLILGTYSPDKNHKYVQTYLFCGIEINGTTHKVEYFPKTESVTITGAPPFELFTNNELEVYIEIDNTGYMDLRKDNSIAYFKFDKFHVLLNTTERIPWTSHTFQPQGPEGWIAYTNLLACRYAIHSVGSKTSYMIAFQSEVDEATRSKHQAFTASLPSVEESSAATILTLSGENAVTHIEGNHGSYFPKGWMWSQGIAKNASASFSIAAGEFELASFHPFNAVLYLRRQNQERVIFRTIDLDTISFHLNGNARRVTFACSSLWSGYEMSVEIVTTDPSNHILWTPSSTGFSNEPGCHETYTAYTRIELVHRGRKEREIYDFPHTAFEFGGTFIGHERNS